MDLILTRKSFNSWGIISELSDYNNTFKLITLEHSYLNNEFSRYLPKVSEGNYNCVLGVHQLAHGGPFQTYEVLDVPGHSGILFHKGNINKDSEGCILLGESLSNQEILNSLIAFDQFMKFQNNCESFNLKVMIS